MDNAFQCKCDRNQLIAKFNEVQDVYRYQTHYQGEGHFEYSTKL